MVEFGRVLVIVARLAARPLEAQPSKLVMAAISGQLVVPITFLELPIPGRLASVISQLRLATALNSPTVSLTAEPLREIQLLYVFSAPYRIIQVQAMRLITQALFQA